MPILSAAEVADMRTVSLGSFPDVCTIERATPTSDAQGGNVDTWANQATGVPCWVRRPATGTEAEVAGRLIGIVPWAVVLPAGQDITVRDRVVVTSQVGTPRFEVEAVLAPVSIEIVRIVICAGIRP